MPHRKIQKDREDVPLAHNAQETRGESIAKTSKRPYWCKRIQDGQVTKLGTNAGEEDTFDAAEEDLFDAAEED